MPDPGGVWCRCCASLSYRTVDTRACLEGVLRTHECQRCGHRFASLATLVDVPDGSRGHISRKLTPLSDLVLPVR